MLKQSVILGILFTLISTFTYAVVTVIVKANSDTVSTPVILFIQMAVSLLLLSTLIGAKGKATVKKVIKSKALAIHLLRTLFSLGIGYCLFYAVRFIPLVDAVLLANMAPLLVPFLAFIFLRQSLNHRLWIPLLIGFGGVIVILRPDGQIFDVTSLIAFGSAICMAASMLLIRRAATKDTSMTTTFYYFLFGTVISGLISIPFWHALSMKVLLWLIASGVLFFVVQYTLAQALQRVDATVVSSLYYSNIIFAAILAVLIWHTSLPFLTLIGMALAIIGGLLVIRANAKGQREKRHEYRETGRV